ncbi:MAG: ATP synthase F1 subunit gamma [Lachnoclostridium sp.]|nr:ATP synthase F1 subunit gamma [Lachnoclostridium sp.]
MATLRELKGRIGSVASSEKITGAMKMISSAKMHHAEAALRRLLPFRRQIEHILGNLLTADAEFSSPLTVARDVTSVGLVVFGSDDGLCGAYNMNILKQVIVNINDYRARYGDSVKVTIIPIGKKITKASRKLDIPGVTVSEPDGINSKSTGDDVKTFTRQLESSFIDGTFDRVDLLYMNFQSVSRQRLRTDNILPVVPASFLPEGSKVVCRPYIFEPDAQSIFVSVLPMFLLAAMQEVFTENRASEQAARIMAMQSANDNAQKLLEELQLEYNKLRQQSITTELLDIVGGQVR